VVLPVEPGRCRLLAVIRGTAPTNPVTALRDWLLAWGDLLMMRKQLLTFASLAEAEHGERPRAQPSV
jgi:hypothetical protein